MSVVRTAVTVPKFAAASRLVVNLDGRFHPPSSNLRRPLPRERLTLSGLHKVKFASGSLILSDTQLELFTQKMGVNIPSQAVAKLEMYLQRRGNWSSFFRTPGLARPPMCAWNMVLRRR